jgi:hypothetical protein
MPITGTFPPERGRTVMVRFSPPDCQGVEPGRQEGITPRRDASDRAVVGLTVHQPVSGLARKVRTAMAINETVTGNDSVAITGTASTGERTVGVKGRGDSVGVRGEGKTWHGVEGISDSTIGGFGVFGANTARGTGVVGESTGWIAVGGFASSTSQGAAVYGEHKGNQAGVWGHNTNATDQAGPGVVGSSRGTGVIGTSETWMGVHGETKSTTGGAGVSGRSLNPDGTVNQDGVAGFFDGKVVVTNDIILSNADCVEEFDATQSATIEPGTVMVIDEADALQQSSEAYDRRVAGVVSGAGGYKPGIVLGKQDSQGKRVSLGLLGKVVCKADARYGAIEVGDLLTTSPTPGHAMKATDPVKALGAVIGKALRPLEEGQGLVSMLIALQ